LQVWQGLLKFSENYLNLDLQITPFFKNKHFELCCFVMYRVPNIVNRRESEVICHSVWRSRVPTSRYITGRGQIWKAWLGPSKIKSERTGKEPVVLSWNPVILWGTLTYLEKAGSFILNFFQILRIDSSLKNQRTIQHSF